MAAKFKKVNKTKKRKREKTFIFFLEEVLLKFAKFSEKNWRLISLRLSELVKTPKNKDRKIPWLKKKGKKNKQITKKKDGKIRREIFSSPSSKIDLKKRIKRIIKERNPKIPKSARKVRKELAPWENLKDQKSVWFKPNGLNFKKSYSKVPGPLPKRRYRQLVKVDLTIEAVEENVRFNSGGKRGKKKRYLPIKRKSKAIAEQTSK